MEKCLTLDGERCQDGPAARAGVIAGDQLISIDGPDLQPMHHVLERLQRCESLEVEALLRHIMISLFAGACKLHKLTLHVCDCFVFLFNMIQQIGCTDVYFSLIVD